MEPIVNASFRKSCISLCALQFSCKNNDNPNEIVALKQSVQMICSRFYKRGVQVEVFWGENFYRNENIKFYKFNMSKTSWHLHRLEGKVTEQNLSSLVVSSAWIYFFFPLLGWRCHGGQDSFAIGTANQNPASYSRPSDGNGNKRYECANIDISAPNYLQTQLV